MEFLDPAKKRAHRRRLYLGYFLISIGILLATAILVFYSYGYRLDRQTGTITQNGLLFVSTRPEAADIYVNGLPRKEKTNTSLLLPSGDHTLELRRSGYRVWRHLIKLDGGQVRRLDYPLLIPERLVPTDIEKYTAAGTFVSHSPNRQWLIAGSSVNPANLDVYSTAAQVSLASKLQLSPGALTASALPQSLEPVEWSLDGRYLLVKHYYGQEQEFILIDRTLSANAINLNQLYKQPITSVRLIGGRIEQMYVYDAPRQLLQRGTLSNGTLETVATGISIFEPSSNGVLYGSPSTDGKGVGLKLLVAGTTTTIHIRTIEQAPVMDSADYGGHNYVVIGGAGGDKAYIYKDPIALSGDKQTLDTPTVRALVKVSGLRQLIFSPSGRFLLAVGSKQLVVYDNQNAENYTYNTPGDDPSSVRWLDDFRLTSIVSGQSMIYDFDGENLQTLVPASGNIYLSRDNSLLITLMNLSGTDQAVLTQVSLLIP